MRFATLLLATASAVGLVILPWRLTTAPPVGNRSLGQPVDPSHVRQAVFSAGCFWGVEAAFRKVDGVVATEVGYTGGHALNPTYSGVCAHTTGHAEAVRITYDYSRVSYGELLDVFWSCHDPTWRDPEGDQSQYRSEIFTLDADQDRIARQSLAEVGAAGIFKGSIRTLIAPAGPFYRAEEAHQQFYEKQGGQEVCHLGISEVHTRLAAYSARHRMK